MLPSQQLAQFVADSKQLEALCRELGRRGATVHLKELVGGALSFYAAAAIARCGGLHIFVAEDRDAAAYLLNDFYNLLDESRICFFPSSYKRSIAYGGEDAQGVVQRTAALAALRAHDDGYTVVCTYPEALAERVADAETLRRDTIRVAVGDRTSPEVLVDALVDAGFEKVDFVYEPGQYSLRGGIVDVFSFAESKPYRVDFFGDEVDSIRRFEISSQLSSDKLDHIEILPDLTAAASPSERVSLARFAGEEATFWFFDADFVLRRINDLRRKVVADLDDPKRIDSLLTSRNGLLSDIGGGRIFMLRDNLKERPADAEVLFSTAPQPAFNKNFALLADDMIRNGLRGYETYILSENRAQMERLSNIFHQIGRGQVVVRPLALTLHEGFVDNDLKLCLYTDHQIFDRYQRYRINGEIKRDEQMTIAELNQLRPGDYVVHIDHGVGRFDGLVKITENGKTHEAIKLVYKDGDVLFVNVHSLHRISRYKSGDGESPKVYKLGTGAWQKLKNAAKKAVKDISRELIALYAKRKASKGFAFSPDSYLQHELEASFRWEDTPDQQAATAAVKRDMESDQPMDRLICGDVGFGKTEIALRAAFKAVQDGKQVAVLVPTTLLVQQHYETFSERFEGFPVNVAAMSRFQTTKEINEAIEGLETGTVDVVIGTHKLLNPKIKFKDLGLVIIDEEQRFGVEHKETLKALRTNVDVLSLSATPIPRTLEMAVTGIREMSTLATPPEDRLPVLTYVGAYEDAQVTAAVRRELLRGGQVFYVHNRVQDISSIADKIHTLVPEAHVGIAHGKMGEKQLDQIIRDFWHRDIDVLVCTTIIETGLDISNANTLIVDHADRFGLSQLHQLRGRVGRGRERAYAYFLYDPSKPMTEQSHDRLATIAQNTALGSGFDVAMKDLELRGTGNLLGDEQSGHIEGVGFDLYVRMVSEAVEKYKEPEENVEPVAVSIDLPIEASIPIEYIDSDKLRLEAYRKLASARNEADLKDLEEELTDRYGKPPVEFETLFDVARLKFKARKLGISEILAQSNRVRIGRIDPPESIQMRMGRIYKGTQYRPVTHQLIVPTPFTGSLSQGPMSSDQVVLWTNQLLDDLAWTPSSSKRQSRL